MHCPQCGSDAKVLDSRSADNDNPRYQWLLERGHKVYGWWAPNDFRLRKRRCTNSDCDHGFITIEVGLLDLDGAFADVRENTVKVLFSPKADL